jgi:hypothetical protein
MTKKNQTLISWKSIFSSYMLVVHNKNSVEDLFFSRLKKVKNNYPESQFLIHGSNLFMSTGEVNLMFDHLDFCLKKLKPALTDFTKIDFKSSNEARVFMNSFSDIMIEPIRLDGIDFKISNTDLGKTATIKIIEGQKHKKQTNSTPRREQGLI